ncbi:hypothetical protein [Alcanivorax sp. 1008]|uniref:hypothetical protein n=1 Tax=Alcanivorax sp. 1008 TaxID=2816853 RepID=UPI001D6E5F39|nr:hypothetical protein [Alcanivorax sp. 1008]MCC1496739.1 hypothetical protein [Alcanivorax sp. 1008]
MSNDDISRRSFFARIFGRDSEAAEGAEETRAALPSDPAIKSQCQEEDDDTAHASSSEHSDVNESLSEDEVFEKIAEEIHESGELTDEKKEEISKRYGVPVSAVAGVAAVLMLMPQDAHAFSSSSIIKRAVRQLKPILTKIMSAFGGDLFAAMNQGASTTSTAIGMTGDRIAGAMTDIHNREVVLAARPDAASCVNDAGGVAAVASKDRTDRMTRDMSGRSATELMENRETVRKLIAETDQRRAKFGENNEDLNAATFIKNGGYSKDEEQAAMALRNRLRTGTILASRALAAEAADTPEGKLYEAAQAEFVAKSNVSESVINRVMSSRVRSVELGRMLQAAAQEEKDPTGWIKDWLQRNSAGEGLSEMDVLRFEAERRYANPEWKRTVRESLMSPEALLREQLVMLAFQNHLLVEQVKQNDELLMLSAVSLTEQLNSNAGKLKGAWAATASEVKPVQINR